MRGARLHLVYESIRLIDRSTASRFGELMATVCNMDPVVIKIYEGETMANLAEVLKELQQDRSRLDEAIRVIGELVTGNHAGAKRTKRRLSRAARERMAAAQRARWAKARGAKVSPPARTISQAARKRIAAAQRARWAKAKAQNKAA